ncbi:hypothetical protein GDO81_011617 [Engystomops pustulosus]|uniref:Vomeronasal type-1 receptor n=1 Tax=Engystomops pustulosus TaxID=76066 RepID=A0AAV7BGA6_ENGPU|nr:hypothetical protein GDO81_011617 [Engystomops pustulosus]
MVLALWIIYAMSPISNCPKQHGGKNAVLLLVLHNMASQGSTGAYTNKDVQHYILEFDLINMLIICIFSGYYIHNFYFQCLGSVLNLHQQITLLCFILISPSHFVFPSCAFLTFTPPCPHLCPIPHYLVLSQIF